MAKSTSRPRSKSGSGQKPSTATQRSTKSSTEAMMLSVEHIDHHGARQPTQPQLPHSSQAPEHVRATEKSERDMQYADYVNQSRIQAMLDAGRKASPVSPQSTSSPAAEESFTLPGPIVQFSGDEQEMIPPQGGIQQSTPGVMEGGQYRKEQEEPFTAGGGHLHKPHRGGFGGRGGSYAAQGYSEGEGGYGGGGHRAMGQGGVYGAGSVPQPHGEHGQFESGRVRAQSEGRGGHAQQNMGRGERQGGGSGGGRGGEYGRMGNEWDRRVEGQRRGSTPHTHMEEQGDIQNSGPPSLPSMHSGVPPSLQRQVSADGKQPTRSDASFTQYQREIKMREQRHLGDDILTPGINTEVHGVAQDVTNKQEVGGSQEVTGVPYDPNLTCVTCGKVFRIGEIQLYRSHNANCPGTIV